MRRFSFVIIFVFQMGSYFFVGDYLQFVLNKIFKSNSYVFIILFLLGVLPILIFILLNRCLCNKDNEWKVKNIIYTNISFLVANLIYYIFLIGDDNFWGIGLTLYSFWVFVVSIALIVYYFIKGTKTQETEKIVDGSLPPSET